MTGAMLDVEQGVDNEESSFNSPSSSLIPPRWSRSFSIVSWKVTSGYAFVDILLVMIPVVSFELEAAALRMESCRQPLRYFKFLVKR
ncbi:UNVERIFIED_CONTAM: hypothetical protein Sradi_0847400 [Sesamum radiatum]|uniref:Uncharacterized protein n=1 Tax=Sesamum radiatum TaxID=300843 RepID=A0AAW2V1D3_SESRA